MSLINKILQVLSPRICEQCNESVTMVRNSCYCEECLMTHYPSSEYEQSKMREINDEIKREG